MEKNTYWMLHMLFKSFEDVIWDKRDSLWSCFVTTAKWYLPKSENLFISLNWIICSFTSWYWTVHVFEFFNLLLAVLVQLKVDPFPTALWYSTSCGHCSVRRVFSAWKSSILHANSTRKTRAKHTCKKNPKFTIYISKIYTQIVVICVYSVYLSSYSIVSAWWPNECGCMYLCGWLC